MIRLLPKTVASGAVAASSDRPATAILHDSPDARLVVFRIAPGQQVTAHRSTSTVTIAVLRGNGHFVGERDAVVEVAAGDLVVYDPNELHGMRAGDAEMLLLATITPRPGSR